MAIKPLSPHYAIENPATVHDEEALTALELAGRTLAKVNEIVGAQNALENRTDDKLNEQDTELARFESEVIPSEADIAVQAYIVAGKFDQSINKWAGDLDARLAALVGAMKEGSTTMDGEIVAARVDHEGYAHESLYKAITWRDTALSRQQNYANIGYVLMSPHWEQGSFSATTLENAVNSLCLRTAEIIAVPRDSIRLIVGEDYLVKLYEYTYADGVYTWLSESANNLAWTGGGDHRFTFDPAATHFRGVIKRVDGTEIQPSEYVNILMLYRTTMFEYFDEKTSRVPGLVAAATVAKTAFDNENYNEGWNLANTRRWFMGKTIPGNSFIKKIGVYCNMSRDSLKIGVWSKDGNSLSLLKEVDTPVTAGVNYIDLGVHSDMPMVLSFYAAEATVSWNNAATDGSTIYGDSVITGNSADISSMTLVEKAAVAVTAYYDRYTFGAKDTIYEVGPDRTYAEIQDAIEAAEGDDHAVILVYPRSTPYARFSTIRTLGGDYPWENVVPRRMDIIGMSEKNCVVLSASGEYEEPAAEMALNGEVRNLTFICDHSDPWETPVKGGYAVHIDGRIADGSGWDMSFKECTFISYQAPAVGVGLNANTSLTFKDCAFINMGDPSYTPVSGYSNIADYGVLYCHTATVPAENQYLTLDNCRFYSEKGSKGLWLSAVGDYTPFTLSAYHNTILCEKADAKRVVMDSALLLSADSFGNNSSVINTEVKE